MEKRFIYLDNAATTPLCAQAAETLAHAALNDYGNASSIYSVGRAAKQLLEESRQVMADAIGAKANEIYFTSGGTESDNWAIKGVTEALKGKKGKHIITSQIEHHAVLHVCEYLAKNGFEVTYIGVDSDGVINLDELKNAIRSDTVLISIMAANNEIGTIQPIKAIGEIARANGVLFHTDAVQAFCQLDIDVNDMCIDLLSASAHKVNGPKGVGFLYVRSGVRINRLLHGGAQERGKRATTENVPAIAAFAAAVKHQLGSKDERIAHEVQLRDYLIGKVLQEFDFVRLNGHRTNRLPNNANFSFRFIEGEALLMMLDMAGICASSGSACTSGSLDPSHVLLAIGLPHEIAHGSLRLTLSHETAKDDIDYTVDKLKGVVNNLRAMSPLYEDYIKNLK